MCLKLSNNNSKNNTSSGRVQSVLLLALSVILSLCFQYVVVPWLDRHKNSIAAKHNPLVDFVTRVWSCKHDDDCPVANYGVYRICACTTLFFSIAAIASNVRPRSNGRAWSAKYSVYLLLLMASVLLVPNHPWLGDIYVPFARLASAIFIVLQQLILIDCAYRWNDAWLNKHWLRAILACCVLFFTVSFASLLAMYHYFNNSNSCNLLDNQIFVILTFVFIVTATVVQLLSQQANLLASSIVSLHATYLLYSAISKNPANSNCYLLPNHPNNSNHNDVLSIVAGVFLTFLSLVWTGWAFTSLENNNYNYMSAADENEHDVDGLLDVPLITPSSSFTGLVTNTTTMDDSNDTASSTPLINDMWKLNVHLVLVSCWVCVTLTGWGTSTTASSDDASVRNMYIIMSSQWVALSLYIWTLVAPRLFPDRDFS